MMQQKRKYKSELTTSARDCDSGQLRHLLALWARHKAMGTHGVGPQLKSPGWYKLIAITWGGVRDFESTSEYSESDYKLVDLAVLGLPRHLSDVIKAEHGVIIDQDGAKRPYYVTGKSKRAKAKVLGIHESTYKDRLRLAEEQLVFELRGLWAN